MAEIATLFLSPLIKVFFDKVASGEFVDFFRRWKLDHGLLKKMKIALLSANAVLEDAEKKQVLFSSLGRKRSFADVLATPQVRELKIDFNVAVGSGCLWAAAVCRDSGGKILSIRISSTRGYSPLKGEARAARLAFALAEDFSNHTIWMEGDSLVSIDQILQVHSVPDWLIIRNLLDTHCLWHLRCISRDCNGLAHNLAQWGLSSGKVGV